MATKAKDDPDPSPQATPQDPPIAIDEGTSAGIVRRGPKTKRELSLETHVSKLEDEKKTMMSQLSEMTKLVDGARLAPSVRKPGKSLLDEVNDFLGFNS